MINGARKQIAGVLVGIVLGAAIVFTVNILHNGDLEKLAAAQRTTISELNSRLSSIGASLADASKQIAAGKEQLAIDSAANKRATDEAAAARAASARLADQLRASQAAVSSLSRTNSDLAGTIGQIANGLDRVASSAGSITQGLADLKKLVDDVIAKL